MTALDLLQRLHRLGIALEPSPDGTVRCRASKGVLTPELLDAMRQYKTALHALVEARVRRDHSQPAEPLTQYYPCVVCGSPERWDDHGIWRCVACWPSPER
jgi:hypothetical protein